MRVDRLKDKRIEFLLKRKKLMKFLIGIFFGVITVWIVLLIIDLRNDRNLLLFIISGLLAAMGMIWIPIFGLREVNKEIERRRVGPDE